MSQLGISGKIAKTFLSSQITPVLMMIAALLGVFALIVTPKEEDPQINSTMATVYFQYPGASAEETEQIVTTKFEKAMVEIKGVNHIYSMSRPGESLITIEFEVNYDQTESIVRLYDVVESNYRQLDPRLGITAPVIEVKDISNVPILTLTLHSNDKSVTSYDLNRVAKTMQTELYRIKGIKDIGIVGSKKRVVKVELDKELLANHELSISDIKMALGDRNLLANSGSILNNNTAIPVQTGSFLYTIGDVENSVVASKGGSIIRLKDVVKDVQLKNEQPENYVRMIKNYDENSHWKNNYEAITLVIKKQSGSNAIDVAKEVIDRVEQLKGIYIPNNIEIDTTRNYGDTAYIKVKTLVMKLIFATSVVVLLIFFTLGAREAFVVGVSVLITLMLTIFASLVIGYTLNRVSLFALIFSIGILVDDAIVVVENIHRRMALDNLPMSKLIPIAVDEVGKPTILATFTVIVALLPMAFVTGLMGPYMSPIPINASVGMLISLIISFAITPWLAIKFFPRKEQVHHDVSEDGKKKSIFNYLIGFFLIDGAWGKVRRIILKLTTYGLIIASVSLAVNQYVILKMLPFDNKQEFQIMVDLPEDSTLEETYTALDKIGQKLSLHREISDYQMYAGISAPINFNGLVRQYDIRKGYHLGDIQVNLIEGLESSHQFAKQIRSELEILSKELGAVIKVVEVPPGPPVLSPLVAEVYGINYNHQITIAEKVKDIFKSTPDIVDIDDSIESNANKYLIHVDSNKAARSGLSHSAIVTAVSSLIDGETIGFLHKTNSQSPIPIVMELPEEDKTTIDEIVSIKIKNHSGQLVSLGDVVRIKTADIENTIYHKDLLPVVYVTGDMSGKTDSPLYGMFEINKKLSHLMDIWYISQPPNPYKYSIKWDGEWQITYETFRDMGIAYGIGLIMIYLLLIAQFKSYRTPLIVMSPIPFTIIGIMPAHALLDSPFTATSMIGMIALAGIIIRNSILLVDFINREVEEGGDDLKAIVIKSAKLRAKPIILTGFSAIFGAVFILSDPIFNGLAIALISGIFVSMLMTLITVPIAYYSLLAKQSK